MKNSYENKKKKWTILGLDPEVLVAVWANVVSWFVSTVMPSFLPLLLPKCHYEVEVEADDGTDSTDRSLQNNDSTDSTDSTPQCQCISIGRPGGIEQLRVVSLKPTIVTKGYNVGVDGSPFISTTPATATTTTTTTATDTDTDIDTVVIQNHAFSINYADCAIRWGLYESAKQFVGWPIVPGFDVAGIVTSSPTANSTTFNIGDRVFGCTLFGAYSTRVAIPEVQLRKIPSHLSFAEAAALPAVSLTALYALHLAGHYPISAVKKQNRGILIHSAAGGVGGMAVQMAKLLGLDPIVGVVGRTHKVDAAKALGCHHVIDKSKSSDSMWEEAEFLSPDGYSAIFDANGVSTLQESYDHLCPTGRLIVFGFHSNLPLGKALLSPLQCLDMAHKMASMPQFDAMDLVVSNKAVLGFNLSFFAQERELVSMLFDQVCTWIESGSDDGQKLMCPPVAVMEGMENIGKAHDLIMSGQSVGKIVITMPPVEEPDEI